MKPPHPLDLFSQRLMQLLLLCLFVGVLTSAQTSYAADDKELKNSQELVKRLQQKTKQLEQEKAQLIADKSKTEANLNANTEQMEKSTRSLSVNNKKIMTLTADVEILKNTLLELQSRNLALADQNNSLQGNLNKVLEDKRNLEASLGATETALTSSQQTIAECTTRNQILVKTGESILKQYEEKSCLSSLAQKEPLTKLKRVGVENRYQEYQEMLESQLMMDAEAQSLSRAKQRLEASKTAEERRLKLEEDKRVEAEDQRTKNRERKRKEQREINSVTRSLKNSIDRLEW
jgi:chromosome segregation ATPase